MAGWNTRRQRLARSNGRSTTPRSSVGVPGKGLERHTGPRRRFKWSGKSTLSIAVIASVGATSTTTEIVNNSTDAVRLDVNAEEFTRAEEEPFHVVVGMFTRQENAAIVQTQAAQKGYKVNIEKGRKYYRVVIPFSPSEATWVQAQKQLAKDITSDAWIWESRFK